jgi:hypothetical protein
MSASLLALASVAGTVTALTAAAPAQADPPCTFTNDTIALRRTDSLLLVPTVEKGGKAVGPNAVLFDHLDPPFTEFDRTDGSAGGKIGDPYRIDVDFNSSKGNEHYIGFITTKGGATGWIQNSNPQISFTIPDGQMTCTSDSGGGQAGTKTATVLQSTDIFNKPQGDPYKDANGNNKFKAPGSVQLVAPDLCKDNWCHVVGAPEVPQGPAWIYIGDGMGTYP